jgi:hypothetical protein
MLDCAIRWARTGRQLARVGMAGIPLAGAAHLGYRYVQARRDCAEATPAGLYPPHPTNPVVVRFRVFLPRPVTQVKHWTEGATRVLKRQHEYGG